MTVPHLQALAQVFADRLLNTAVEGVFLVVLVCILLRLIDRQNSETRFAIWFSALVAIAALPFFSGPRFVDSHFQTLPAATLRGQIVLSGSWAFYLFAAWMAGAGLLLLRLTVGLWRVRYFRRNCSDVDLASLNPAIAGIFREIGSRRRVKFCVSSDITVPGAIGFLRPAIVFPAWLLPQLSAEEINVILLHEFAHLRRWDDWTNLAQKIVKALFFFHPAVWWIESRLTLEREMACDDMVLATTASPRAYASSLISFAERLQSSRGLALVQALLSGMQHMALRLSQILDAKRPSRTTPWKPVLGMSAGLLTLVLGAAPYMPRFVAFQNQPKQSQTGPIRATNAEAQPSAILAEFAPRAAAVPPRLRVTSRVTSPRKAMVVRARAAQEYLPAQETIIILQTAQYDASGSGIWTLCIWRVGGRNSAERRLEAIVVSSI
jgi:beta-lactamase regulating signal transducer with metallopeptidase domain